MSQEAGEIQVRVDAPVGTIVISRPQRANALDRQLLRRFLEALHDLHSSGQVKAVIVTGGGATFCSGTDLRELNQSFQEDAPFEVWHQDSQLWLEIIETMLRFPKPVIAAVNGPAVGAGVALMLAADFVIASETASLSVPESHRGLSAGPTLPLLNFRLGASVAAQLLFTSCVVDADRAEKLGLFHELVADDMVWARAFELANTTAKGARESHQMAKQMINETIGESLMTQLSIGAANMAAARTTDAAREGVSAFLEKRDPKW